MSQPASLRYDVPDQVLSKTLSQNYFLADKLSF